MNFIKKNIQISSKVVSGGDKDGRRDSLIISKASRLLSEGKEVKVTHFVLINMDLIYNKIRETFQCF
jgi:hypothetical protein